MALGVSFGPLRVDVGRERVYSQFLRSSLSLWESISGFCGFFKEFWSFVLTSMTQFLALSDDSRVPEVDFVNLFGYLGFNFGIWISI